ncbi:MFS transporter [Rhizobium sp. PP-F2F-G48]|nr:MFS transporter [Rhizobium sp. PP-F2F-G48]TCM52568.1 MFS transporter [Rhizobium sp. PP-F2F-G48]
MQHSRNPKANVDPHRWTALAILLTGAFLPPLDFFIVNLALPSIREDFHASASTMQLIISGYATTYAVMLITGGRLEDLYGRRNVFLAGMLAFAAASALCGFAWSPTVLVVGRVLQGFAAAIMAPQALASINAIFPDHEKSRALSLYALTFGVASMAGLFLGGSADYAQYFWARMEGYFPYQPSGDRHSSAVGDDDTARNAIRARKQAGSRRSSADRTRAFCADLAAHRGPRTRVADLVAPDARRLAAASFPVLASRAEGGGGQ